MAEVSNSTNLCDGLHFWDVPESGSLDRGRAIESILSPGLLYRYQLHHVQMTALTTIIRNVNLEVPDSSGTLNSLIGVFDVQVQKAVPQTIDEMSKPDLSEAPLFLLQ